MNKNKQLFLSFALLALFIAPFQASGQTTAVSVGTATQASGQSDELYKKDCKLIKQIDREIEDVEVLDLSPEHIGLSLVRFTKFSIIEETVVVTNITYYACPAEVVAKLQTSSDLSVSTFISQTLVGFFSYIIIAINGILSWVLWVAGYLLIAMIGQGKFITSDIVTQAWPFVQGLANLGFIFALLYIALATTLRMESVSTSVQKLLPKLLIAALLVNFSLVIGGLIIDASRLVMAAEIKIMGGGSLDYENFTAKLIESSKNDATSLSNLELIDTSNASAAVLKMIQSAVFLGLLTAAIFIIAVNLFIRYVALLILLILSPMAYLSFALPNTSKYASQWWGMFIKWVLYGPIVLFFLIVITRIQNVNIKLIETADANPLFTVFFNQFIHFAIVIALFFVANSVGKKVAGAGSDAVMGFAKKNPRAAFIAGSSLVGGGFGGAALGAAGLWAGGMTKNSGRDFVGDVKSSLIKKTRGAELFSKDTFMSKTAKIIAGPDRDKEGNRKAGEQDSVGSWAADKIGYLKPNAAKEAIKESDRIRALPAINRKAAYDAAQSDYNNPLHSSKLMNKKVAVELSKDQLTDLAKHGSKAQVKATISHKDVVRKMDSKDKSDLYNATRTIAKTATSPGEDWSDISKQIDSRMQDLANEK